MDENGELNREIKKDGAEGAGGATRARTSRRDLLIAALALAVLVAAIVIALALDGQEKDPEPLARQYYDWFDTVSVIYDYSGDGEEAFAERLALIEEELSYYHRLFDIYNEYDGMNNLATVNRLAATEAVEVDPELIAFLNYSVGIYGLTEGEVNIAMGAVLRLWHEARSLGSLDPANARLPDVAALTEAAGHCDISRLSIDAEGCTVRFLDPKMSLDVGAIAKGYATERAAQALASSGASAVVLDIGGNLRAVGEKPSGKGWSTGVRNPDLYAEDYYIYRFEIKDCSAVTSGDYERFYTVAGVKYHHIIDPDTLMPATHFASVTVTVGDSGLADGLSTALFNMTYEEGKALLGKIEGARAVWVTHGGEILTYGE